MPGGVTVRFTKWTSRPHWEFEACELGEDAHGLWLGMPVGTRMSRPGMDVSLEHPHVLLVPDASFMALFSRKVATEAEPDPVVVYVDVTTVPVVGNGEVSAVDLDLDVIRTLSSRVFLDDEDEFRQHQIDLEYPPEIVELATITATRLMAQVAQRVEPFGRAADRWLDVICG